MGNALCRSSVDCFNMCFRKRYDRWSLTSEFHPFGSTTSQITQHRDHGHRNRIAEYITWALNRSRSPLLLDDVLSYSRVDSIPQDLNGPNTVSWMSDAASSDASHLLYREVDPYNQASFAHASPGSSQFNTPDVPPKEGGGWVAVTKLSDSKHGTSTSAVYIPDTAAYDLTRKSSSLNQTDALPVTLDDEELDGPELARLARSLWPRNASRKRFSSDARTAKQRLTSAVPPQLATAPINPPFSESTPAARPTQLNLRTSSSKGPLDQETVGSNAVQIDSPIELDWDHEPGTVSPREPRKFSSQRQRLSQDSFQHINFNTNDNLQLNKVNPVSMVPRRRVPGYTRSVAVLPLTGNSPPPGGSNICPGGDVLAPAAAPLKSTTNRLPNSEALIRDSPIRTNARAPKPDSPHSNLLASPSTYLPDTLLSGNPQAPNYHELVDSGFVGFNGNCAENESDDGGCRTVDLQWEHELFESPRSLRLTSAPTPL